MPGADFIPRDQLEGVLKQLERDSVIVLIRSALINLSAGLTALNCTQHG